MLRLCVRCLVVGSVQVGGRGNKRGVGTGLGVSLVLDVSEITRAI